MTTIALALALVLTPEVLPFGSTITLPPGSVKSYSVTVQNTNRFGPYISSTNGWIPDVRNTWIKAIVKGSSGWKGNTLFAESQKLIWLTGNSGQNIASPWWNGRYADAWVSISLTTPMGVVKRECWPSENALTIIANDCTIYVSSNNSPSRGLLVRGSNNTIEANVSQGVQSNDQIDLSAIRIEGDHNRLSGFVQSTGCAVFIKGKGNVIEDLYAKGLSVLDDAGLITVDDDGHGTVVRNSVLVQDTRVYEPSHQTSGVFLDDRTSYCLIENVKFVGFWYPVAVHGGDYNKIGGKAYNCRSKTAVWPHFSTPTKQPIGNVVSITEAN